MPILDLRDAAPLYPKPEPVAAPTAKRTMNPQNTAAALMGAGGQGGFAAAKMSKLLMDFVVGSRSADQDIFGDNRTLRARARKLALDDPFFRKYLAMLVQNTLGPKGMIMQAQLTGVNGSETAQTKAWNLRIEEAWAEFCEVGNCTADGKFSFVEIQQLAIKNWGREGENLVKFVYGRQFNRFGFALQPLDNDQLDDSMMQALPDGGEIRMGVEVDKYRRPLAFHLFDGHPYDMIGGGSRLRRRIPAEFCVHTMVNERPGQTRGYTQAASVILSINQLNRYYEAEVVAARFSASKFMVIEEPASDGMADDDDEEDDGSEGPGPGAGGGYTMGGESGALVLDRGQVAKFIDPTHPNQAFASFTKTAIRAIATGLLADYPTLGNDLEGVNFSSIRAGMLDMRDSWRVIQAWFIDHFLKPIFREWLKMALLTVLPDISLTPAQFRQFAWRARGWEWVDPVKDADAAILRLANGFSTYEIELGKLGLDVETTFKTLAKERQMLKDLGLVVGTDVAGDQGGKGVASGDESAAEQVEGANAKPEGAK